VVHLRSDKQYFISNSDSRVMYIYFFPSLEYWQFSASQVTVWSLKLMIMPDSLRRSRLVSNNHIICDWWLRIKIYMKCPRRVHLFLEVEHWEWNCHKNIPVLDVVNLLPTVLQVVVSLSSVLMNGNIAELYASRMILLLAPVSSSALSRYFSWLTMRLTANSLIDFFAEILLLA
jgi:hypothetical protein